MGADGGSIPTRGELVQVKKKDVILDPQLKVSARWKYCRLTSDLLEEPVMSCELGRLYNKTAVLEFLLARKDQPPEKIELMQHIRGLKDLTELKLKKSPGYDDTFNAEDANRGKGRWCCPLTGVEMSGFNKFFFNLKHGFVVSERAVKEVPNVFGEDTDPDHIIGINGDPDEVAVLWTSMSKRRQAAKAAKAAKKAASTADGFAAPGPLSTKEGKDGKKDKKRKASSAAGDAQNAASKKVAVRKPQINMPDSTFKTVKQLPDLVKNDKTKSAAFKSLFNSSVKKKGDDFKSSYTSRTTYSRW